MRRREMGKGEGLETAFDQAGVWKVVASRPFWTSRSQPGSSWLQTMSLVPCTSSVPTEPASICCTDRTLPIQSTTYGGTAHCVIAESFSLPPGVAFQTVPPSRGIATHPLLSPNPPRLLLTVG